ncbi:MAG TPA: hypothetical protein VKS21_08900, partial [Spirochaetota bacterium]|nr:hypothetical protein [Spirochaetota bacterium]
MRNRIINLVQNFAGTIILLAVCSGLLYSNYSSMLLEFTPTSVAVGRGFDLLDPLVPMNRTYSGLLGLKDKTEVVFNHTMYTIQGLTINNENALLGLNKTFLKGIKIGGYVNYLNPGGIFVHKNSAGMEADTYKFLDLMVGVPIVFDVKSLNLKRLGAEGGGVSVSPGVRRFLNAVNMGINLNYYNSKLTRGSANTFFADVNISSKFKVGYIGMPKKVSTREMIEAERKDVVAATAESFNAKMEELNQNEELSEEDKTQKKEEYTEQKEKELAEIKTAYDQKLEGIDEVQSTRAKIFRIYNNDDVMMSKSNVESVVQDAKDELQNLLFIASNALRKNYIFLQRSLVNNVNNNQSNISKYRSEFREICENEELKEVAEKFFDLYKDYVVDRYYKVIQEVMIDKLIKDEEELKNKVETENYMVGPEDTWDSIAAAKMGSTNKKRYLLRFNGMNENYNLEEGETIEIPGEEYITGVDKFEAQKAKRLEKIAEYEEENSPYQDYKVQSNDTSWSNVIINVYYNLSNTADSNSGVTITTNTVTNIEETELSVMETNTNTVANQEAAAEVVVKTNITTEVVTNYADITEKIENVLDYNELDEDTPPVIGQTVKIPIEERMNIAARKREEFEKEKAVLETELEKFEMSEKESLYFNNVISKMDKRTAMFQRKKELNRAMEESYRNLNNKIAAQYNKFDEVKQTMLDNLKKIALRKELDQMNAEDEREKSDAFFEYKKKERKLFKGLLLTIYRSKKEMIEELIETEAEKLKSRQKEINELYDKKAQLLKEDTEIAVQDAGEDAAAVTELETDFEKKLSVIETDRKNDLASAEDDYERKQKEYEWELYLTELIYLGS